MKQYLSVAAFARRYNVTRQAVYLWIKSDLIQTRQINGVIYIPVMAERPKLAVGRPRAKDVVLA